MAQTQQKFLFSHTGLFLRVPDWARGKGLFSTPCSLLGTQATVITAVLRVCLQEGYMYSARGLLQRT